MVIDQLLSGGKRFKDFMNEQGVPADLPIAEKYDTKAADCLFGPREFSGGENASERAMTRTMLHLGVRCVLHTPLSFNDLSCHRSASVVRCTAGRAIPRDGGPGSLRASNDALAEGRAAEARSE